MEQLKDADHPFALPIGKAQMIGLVSGLLADQTRIAENSIDTGRKSYKYFRDALPNIDQDPAHVIDCIRLAIKDKIPALALLTTLMKRYSEATHEETKRKIAVAEAAVMLAHHVYCRNASLVKTSHVEVPVHCLAEVFINAPLGELFSAGALLDLGISASITLLVRASFGIFEKAHEKKEEHAFQWLTDEMMNG